MKTLRAYTYCSHIGFRSASRVRTLHSSVGFRQKRHKTSAGITVSGRAKSVAGGLVRRAVRSCRGKARWKRQKNRISMPSVEAEAARRQHRAHSARARLSPFVFEYLNLESREIREAVPALE
ncbi:unnamed protein product, partial [Iphiclides podalirius]